MVVDSIASRANAVFVGYSATDFERRSPVGDIGEQAVNLCCHDYLLAVTDPPIEDKYSKKEEGEYAVKTAACLCISIGESFNRFCYKLVAGMITPDRAKD